MTNRAAAANKTTCDAAYQGLAAGGESLCADGPSDFESSFCP